MQRKMRLIRELLEWAEVNTEGRSLSAPELEEYSSNEIQYHIELCRQAGFLEVERSRPYLRIKDLTWAGHSKLDKLRGTS